MPVNLYHTLILSNGKVFSSGKDDCNQLGRAGKPWLFTEVDSPIRFVSVGAGCDGNSVAVAEDGSLWGWGANFKYQIGLPKMKIHHTPEKALIPDVTFVSVSAGDTFCIALDSEGFVWEFGEIYVQKRTHEPEKVPMIHNIRVICAGGYYSTALDYNGRVWSWGRNDDGQLGIGNMGDCSTPQVICGIGPIQQLATGYRHSLLLDMDGQVWTFGANPDGR
jgi:alpha-tubulin suppressor-like RCC1 family protein